MKVTGVRTFPVETPPPHHGGFRWMFLRLDTDAGISGYGEVMLLASGLSLPVVSSVIEDLVAQYVVGHDPYDSEALFDRLYAQAGYSHYPEQTKLSVISGLDMACWDLVGKDLGRPVHKLIGGSVRDRVRTYTYIYDDPASARSNNEFWLHPEEVAQRAAYYADLGFNALKLDPMGNSRNASEESLGQIIPVQYSLDALETAERTIRLIREAVGTRCDILIGTHGQMTAAGAIRLAKRLEPFDPLWFEEPVPPENVSEMAKVARGTSIPITTGERLTTKYDFARLITAEAADIFNLDIGQVGGLLEAKKIAALAEAHYLQITPHVYGGPLIAAASVAFGASTPNFLITESIERGDGFYAELVDPPLEWKDSYYLVSDRPGLGHDLREDVAARYAPH